MKRSKWSVLLGSVVMLACDAEVAEPPDARQSPQVAHALATAEEPTAAEISNALAAEIITLFAGTTLTKSYANAHGRMEFVGTHASLTADMQLYRDGLILLPATKTASFEAPIWMVLADFACIMQGGECSHSLGVELPNVYLDKPCGHLVKGSASGKAQTKWMGSTYHSVSAQEDALSRKQESCPISTGGDTGGGGGGSDPVCPEGVIWNPYTGCESGGGSSGGSSGGSGGGSTTVEVCTASIEGDALVVECIEYTL